MKHASAKVSRAMLSDLARVNCANIDIGGDGMNERKAGLLNTSSLFSQVSHDYWLLLVEFRFVAMTSHTRAFSHFRAVCRTTPVLSLAPGVGSDGSSETNQDARREIFTGLMPIVRVSSR